jgi:hypothetical protein
MQQAQKHRQQQSQCKKFALMFQGRPITSGIYQAIQKISLAIDGVTTLQTIDKQPNCVMDLQERGLTQIQMIVISG